MTQSATVHVEDRAVVTADETRLAATLFTPAHTPIAAVLLLSAASVPRSYYRHFAAYLAENGFLVLTFDYRGVGGSRRGSLRGLDATMSDWAIQDAAAALAALKRLAPGLRLLGVGHSFGGQSLGVADALAELDGVYTVAAQLGWWGHWPSPARYRMRALFQVAIPTVTRVWGYLPGWAGLGEDMPRGVALEWSTWLSSRNYLLDHVPGSAERLQRFPGEVVLLGLSDDDYAPPAAVEALSECFDASRCTLQILRPEDVGMSKIGHFGFFRRGESAEKLWPTCLSVLQQWAVQGDRSG